MKYWQRSFNIYLLAAAVVLGSGCGSTGHLSMKKDYATLRVYLEVGAGDGSLVRVGHDKIPIYVDSEPMLTEADLTGATLLDNPEGPPSIEVTFNDHGKLVLDMNTEANRGRRLVFFCLLRPKGVSRESQEGDTSATERLAPGQPNFSPWLAAIPIRTGITGGALHFTPNVSGEEADMIVRGLNNMISDFDKMKD